MAERNEGNDNVPELATTSAPPVESSLDSSAGNQNGSTANQAGSIFASPKLAVASSNPFAVRSPPNGGRENTENNPSPSIIAPSRFGAAAAATTTPAPSSLASFVKDDGATECNGAAASKPFLRPSMIGSGIGAHTNALTTSGSSSGRSSNNSDNDNSSSNSSSHSSSSSSNNNSNSSSSSSSSNVGASSSSILKPTTLGNPFARPVDVGTDESVPSAAQSHRKTDDEPTTGKANASGGFLMPSRLNHVTPSHATSTTSTDAREASAVDGEQPPPDAAASSTSTISSSSSSSLADLTKSASLPTSNLFSSSTSAAASCGGFVFGQKLHERVANPASGASAAASVSVAAVATQAANGGVFPVNDNLFTVIAKQEKAEAEPSSLTTAGAASTTGAAGATGASNGVAVSKTLTDSARELQEARAAKRKYDEVAVITGEEDEQNALQVYGRLFTFDKVQGTWIERGRGTLRLNDKQLENEALQSRLIMRTQGSLRVILNTKIWSDMTVDKASTRSIRLTAVDGDQIRVFLLMASLKDTETLFNALEWRLATVRAHHARTSGSASSSSSAAAVAAAAAAAAATNAGVPSPSGACLDGDSDQPSSPKRRSLSPSDAEESDEAKKKRSE